MSSPRQHRGDQERACTRVQWFRAAHQCLSSLPDDKKAATVTICHIPIEMVALVLSPCFGPCLHALVDIPYACSCPLKGSCFATRLDDALAPYKGSRSTPARFDLP
jgi:hypothetical protein